MPKTIFQEDLCVGAQTLLIEMAISMVGGRSNYADRKFCMKPAYAVPMVVRTREADPEFSKRSLRALGFVSVETVIQPTTGEWAAVLNSNGHIDDKCDLVTVSNICGDVSAMERDLVLVKLCR